ncbi:gamma-glutamyl-gamma-aminobutyrate hydrolase family protein [Nocardioidaceae bacterium SCSIO 66511]|nr:gamma-glutamyl-gamma-aminobutyrate hydrolase family protein [Nocardioidaceae bacterium SCSIO 66511]
MTVSASIPRIRVLAPLYVPDASDEVRGLVDRLAVSALRLLSNAGAEVSVIDVSAAERLPVDVACTTDGVLLLGGGDIDPALYGAESGPNLYGVDRRADDYTIEVITAARRGGIPVLGICRGNQLINVAAGGTLYTDIADPALHHGVAPAQLFVDEAVTLAPDSWVSRLYGTDRLVVRSGHHQAIREVGTGLRTCAVADDGIVEGVEAESGWCVGVQWHPEDPDGPSVDAATIFKGFVEACGE